MLIPPIPTRCARKSRVNCLDITKRRLPLCSVGWWVDDLPVLHCRCWSSLSSPTPSSTTLWWVRWARKAYGRTVARTQSWMVEARFTGSLSPCKFGVRLGAPKLAITTTTKKSFCGLHDSACIFYVFKIHDCIPVLKHTQKKCTCLDEEPRLPVSCRKHWWSFKRCKMQNVLTMALMLDAESIVTALLVISKCE